MKIAPLSFRGRCAFGCTKAQRAIGVFRRPGELRCDFFISSERALRFCEGTFQSPALAVWTWSLGTVRVT
jgi:hypothetical protein